MVRHIDKHLPLSRRLPNVRVSNPTANVALTSNALMLHVSLVRIVDVA